MAYLDIGGPEEREYSEQTARLIDTEVRTLVEEAHTRAQDILSQRRKTLDAVAALLQQREVIGGAEIAQLVREQTRVPEAG